MLRWLGFKQGSITVQHGAPFSGTSSYRLVKRANLAIDMILGFSTRLLYISVVIGLLLAISSLVMAGIIVINKLRYPDYPLPGWPSVMTAVFFAAGVTNTTIGLIGIYIGQVVRQTRGRPLYFVAEETIVVSQKIIK
jgi:dolichol-phosphate mannosyltransferase